MPAIKSPSLSPDRIKRIEDELTALRSFVIGWAGRDQEGDYRPEFIRQLWRSARQPASRQFKNPEQFLKEIAEA